MSRDEILAHGFAVIDDAIDRDTLECVRAIVERENANLTTQDGARYFVNLTAREEVFRDLVVRTPMLPVAESLLGDDCIISGSCSRTAMPDCPAQRVHRDQWDWWPSMPWIAEIVAVTIVVPLVDFAADNGATRVMPGTHVEPSPRPPYHDEPIVAPAGSCIAFDQRVLHRGGENRSSQPRPALFVTYARSWMKPHTDHRRSTSRGIVESASPTLLRLLGFQRQSSIDMPDGRSLIVDAPGATDFYGRPRPGA